MFRRSCAAWGLWCLCAAAATAGDAPINYLDPPQGTFSDEWMIVELSGQKAGYAHTTMSREVGEITTRSLTYFKLGRAKDTIEVTLLRTTHESLEGLPRSFENIQKMGTTELATRGRVENGDVILVSTQFGFDTKRTQELPENAKMAWGTFRASIEQGFAPGTTYEIDVYEPSMRTDGALKAKVVVGDRVKINHDTKARDAIRVTTTLQMGQGAIDSVSYVDDAGQVMRAETSFAGFNMAMIATSKAHAINDFNPPEFFMDTLVKIDRKIDRNTAMRIRYRLRVSSDGAKVPTLPTTSMQTPGERTERTAIVEVTRLDQKTLKSIENVAAAGLPEEFLASSPSLNTQDDQIVRMSRDAVGTETRPYAMADKLRVYVSRAIKDKNLNIGFATASEVCRNREGDCTEHAVLLAALGRSRGIPSRVVVGLAYVPSFVGVKNVFGFHMWTQFHIGDQWVDFDAALHESDCSPARIALATSSLKDAAIGDIAFAIMDVIRGLEIEIQQIESR